MLITQIISPQIVYSETIHFISGVPLYGRYNRKQRPQKKGRRTREIVHAFTIFWSSRMSRAQAGLLQRGQRQAGFLELISM